MPIVAFIMTFRFVLPAKNESAALGMKSPSPYETKPETEPASSESFPISPPNTFPLEPVDVSCPAVPLM